MPSDTCIACNQACLDHVFEQKTASCLVNPRACNETELNYLPAKNIKKIAVVGAGPAGLAFATVAAGRGHEVTLYDAADKIGGQFNMAKQIPGKEEFYETLRYYQKQLELQKVDVQLNTKVDTAYLLKKNYDEVVLATGVEPRKIKIEGLEHPKVLSYIDVLAKKKEVGKTVAIIGAGGIGFDVAEYLSHDPNEVSNSLDINAFLEDWGVNKDYNKERGGLEDSPHKKVHSARELYLLQRSEGKLGAKLGKTTGWIHRSTLRKKGVNMLGGVTYHKIDDEGLHISIKEKKQVLAVDNVVICAGQVPLRTLLEPLEAAEVIVHLIGGADKAAQLDAKRAIDQASRLAAEV